MTKGTQFFSSPMASRDDQGSERLAGVGRKTHIARSGKCCTLLGMHFYGRGLELVLERSRGAKILAANGGGA